MSGFRLIALAAAIGGLVLLTASLRALLHGLGSRAPLQPVLATLPLAARQRVDLPAGPVVLNAEGRRFSTAFAGLRWALLDTQGRAVPGRPVIFRARRSGLATTRLEILRFDVPGPGAYVLAAEGDVVPDPDARLVLARPTDALRLIAIILGLVLGGGALIAGTVLAIVG
ncbi:MAG: hypothetical protein JNK67_21935 [Alphaproteobacteria bacterium]|nr:hypothetical protein [Alphaproteobacteria bacterium]